MCGFRSCLSCIEAAISTKHLSYQSFQLFGFDFMVDENFKVWLIEINGAPACAQSVTMSVIFFLSCYLEPAGLLGYFNCSVYLFLLQETLPRIMSRDHRCGHLKCLHPQQRLFVCFFVALLLLPFFSLHHQLLLVSEAEGASARRSFHPSLGTILSLLNTSSMIRPNSAHMETLGLDFPLLEFVKLQRRSEDGRSQKILFAPG